MINIYDSAIISRVWSVYFVWITLMEVAVLARFIFSVMVLLLVSCGGGGGGSHSNGGDGSNASSSVSVDPCNNNGGMIFGECANVYYGDLYGLDYAPTFAEYKVSSSDKHVQWSIQDIGADNGKVLDITFNDPKKQGQFYIGTPGSGPVARDVSAFKSGTLEFDIRAVDFGKALDPSTRNLKLAVRMDCNWPCVSHPAFINLTTLSEWKHVSISLADFNASGLDFSKVTVPFVLLPQIATQDGLHLQIDNLQLKKSNSTLVEPSYVYKEDFNTTGLPGWVFVKEFGNPQLFSTANYGAYLIVTWSGISDSARFETTLDSTIDITNKNASVQFYCYSWSSTDKFSFELVATDVNGMVVTTDQFYAWQYPKDTWLQVNMNLPAVFDVGFNPKQVKKIGLRLASLNPGLAQSGCSFDTIRIAKK